MVGPWRAWLVKNKAVQRELELQRRSGNGRPLTAPPPPISTSPPAPPPPSAPPITPAPASTPAPPSSLTSAAHVSSWRKTVRHGQLADNRWLPQTDLKFSAPSLCKTIFHFESQEKNVGSEWGFIWWKKNAIDEISQLSLLPTLSDPSHLYAPSNMCDISKEFHK